MEFEFWSQDVTQAYIQGEDLSRTVFVKPTTDFNLPANNLLKLLKPLNSPQDEETNDLTQKEKKSECEN